MQEHHYYLTSVEIMDHNVVSLSLPVALVSRRSVYRVFEESETIYNVFLEGKILTVKLDGHICLGRLVRERGAEGTHYNIRLIHMQEETEAKINESLRSYGFNSPWKRKHPRISANKAGEDIEVPENVLFHRVAGSSSCGVLNFSASGLSFEFPCGGLSLSEYIGQKIRFHLFTSHGGSLYDLEGHITRMYDEVLAPGRLMRALGVKFDKMSSRNREFYYEMILEAADASKRPAG